MDDMERELGLAIPSLGTLEIEGVPVENGDPVVALNAELPNRGGKVTLHLSIANAKEAFEAGLQIVAALEELTS
jgi:hypothetical protein